MIIARVTRGAEKLYVCFYLGMAQLLLPNQSRSDITYPTPGFMTLTLNASNFDRLKFKIDTKRLTPYTGTHKELSVC